MPKRKREAKPFYRADRNKWCVHFEGRTITLADNEPDAWKELAKLKAGLAAGPCETVRMMADAYLKYAESVYRKHDEPTSEFSVIRRAVNRFCEMYGDVQPGALERHHLRSYQSALIADDLAKSTILHYLDRVRRMIRHAAGQEWITPEIEAQFVMADRGLAANLKLARETAPVKPVDEGRIEAIEPHVSRMVWAMIQVQLLTGMRPAEVTILRRKDIDMRGEVWLFRPARHKLEHKRIDRVVAIGPKAQAILRQWMKVDPEERWFPVRRDSYCTAVRRGCEAAFKMPEELRNLKRGDPRCTEAAAWRAEHCWSPNRLRHNAATTIRSELGLEEARTFLGHSNVETTQIYAERDSRLAAQVALKFG